MSETKLATNAVEYAAQIGRLDFISVLLAIIAILVGLGAIYAFFNFRTIARTQASEVANKIAPEVAERVANEYIQSNIIEIIQTYSHIINNDINDEEADRIANAQDEATNTGDE